MSPILNNPFHVIGVTANRNHRNAKAILILNLCLGWMLFGWVGALV